MKEDNKKGNVKSYAYVSLLNNEEKEANASITGKTDCIDIELSDNNPSGLTYNYPITDTFATTGENIKPVTITLTNRCTEATKSVNYSVILTSLAKSAESYITDEKIKVMVKKGSANLIETKYLSELTSIGSGKSTYNLLMKKLDAEGSNTKAYDTKKPYLIESGSLGTGDSVSYSAYLWIDYNEGSTNANNSTKGQNFASILSVVVNNPETFTE